MAIGIDVSMEYLLGDDPMVLLTLEAARAAGQTVLQERLGVADATVARVDGQDGVGQRVWARVAGARMQLRYHATVEVTRPATALERLCATPMHALPGSLLGALRPSRYCQSDMFQGFVAQRFDGLEGGPRMAAIVEWVADELGYVPVSDATTTALDTFAMREGVCRDYAHLVCALARASGIPARYVSAYAPDVVPRDFHALVEVWLEGGWHLVDATGMARADETVLVAVGRDAADVAFMETQAPAEFVAQSVTVTRAAPQAADAPPL